MSKKVKKKYGKKVVSMLIGSVVGFIFGIILASMSIASKSTEKLDETYFLRFGLLIIFLLISFIVHIIIHEFGHLAAGIISGYKFVSFRVFNIMFLKEDGRLKIKNFGIAGTGGQCLMLPPKTVNDRYPYMLYNLGGSLMNLAASGLFIVPCILLYNNSRMLSMIFLIFAFVGISTSLMNIIPHTLAGNPNDGYNAYLLNKHEESRISFWNTLHINAHMTKGIRYRDMPEEWFRIPEIFDNPLLVMEAFMYLNYYYDKHEFKKAEELAKLLMEEKDKLVQLQKNELLCELLFLEIIGERRKAEIDSIYTKELKKYIKMSLTHIAKIRILYAYAKLVSCDTIEADEILKKFKKTCNRYPFKGEIENERELIELINEINP